VRSDAPSLLRGLPDRTIALERAWRALRYFNLYRLIIAGLFAVLSGFGRLPPTSDEEDDMLDKAWGLTATSRLSCQIDPIATDLTIELPRYTINHARE
jgi:hypothetical protein